MDLFGIRPKFRIRDFMLNFLYQNFKVYSSVHFEWVLTPEFRI